MSVETRSNASRFVAVIGVVIAVIAGFLVAVSPAAAPSASAANAGDFQAGYLISDANFFDSQSMNTGDVQNFLNSKVGTCVASNGMPCLKDYRVQSTPAMAASAYCASFPGGTMSAAELIVTVSRACGISPKVILVMLQKEQGLITSTSPTARNYSAALGQGCPDGSPCDPNQAGFFYQIYGAARQFQIYMKFPRSFAYQLGWNNILYQANPPDRDRVCGTKSVYIQNDATRALYVYTPYTPNQAALDNLYSTGDFCSSYGNRNFWRLYTDWFGDPLAEPVTGEYAAVWASLGGANGMLGRPTGTVVCIDSRYCQQSFQGGTIFWFPGRGVFGVPMVIEQMWRNMGFIDGSVGFPTAKPVCATDGTCAQSFDAGLIAADAAGGSLVGRQIEPAWRAAGGVAVGGARGPALCGGDQCAQLFARAAFFTGPSPKSVTGPIFTAWSVSGMSAGPMGYPLANADCAASSCTQRFGGGIIVSAGGRGEVIPSAVAQKYIAMGGVRSLGVPLAPATCDNAGRCSQRTATVRIDTFPNRAAIATTAWFLDAWAARGFDQSSLGAPLAEATCSSVTCMQSFEGGVLSGSPSNGVVAVYGQYRDLWMANGGPTGSLGMPLAGDSCNGKNCSQAFQNGVLVWSPATGLWAVAKPILDAWNAAGGDSGSFGLPLGPANAANGMVSQAFQRGTISVRE
jgi:uncharacterized protein with LGFP repeats